MENGGGGQLAHKVSLRIGSGRQNQRHHANAHWVKQNESACDDFSQYWCVQLKIQSAFKC